MHISLFEVKSKCNLISNSRCPGGIHKYGYAYDDIPICMYVITHILILFNSNHVYLCEAGTPIQSNSRESLD